MGSIPHELSLEIFVPKSITQFLAQLNTIADLSQRLPRLDGFIHRLEDEMNKIDAFKRELPLCMVLINDAIAILKEESMHCRTREFIPLKKSNEIDEEETKANDASDVKDKRNWMSSVQLWNIDDESQQNEQKLDTHLLKVVGENYDPFQPKRDIPRPMAAYMPFGGPSVMPFIDKDYKGKSVAELSLVTPETNNLLEESGSSGFKSKTTLGQRVASPTPNGSSSLQPLQSGRKQRRCWSPELHRRFVSALQELGGSQVATPKLIREHMQVEGLTNDEVKSHLQKYRLHMRRLPSSGGTAPNQSTVVVSGELWEDQSGESSKLSRSQSRSPAGPLQLTGAASMEEEDEEEERSENYITSKRHA